MYSTLFYIIKNKIFILAEMSYWVTVKTCMVTLLNVQSIYKIVDRPKALLLPARQEKLRQINRKQKLMTTFFYQS